MKKFLLTTWCLLPLGVGAYHYGPGMVRLKLDASAAALSEAEACAARASALGDEQAADEWLLAVASYDAALAALPAGREEARQRIVLERAKAKLLCSQLPQANGELTTLLEELQKQDGVDPEFLADVRRTQADSEYYMTWLMRLEGAPRDEWEPRIENARQNLKLLAERPGLAESERTELAQDVESAVRLARMDLDELQGLPLPSQ